MVDFSGVSLEGKTAIVTGSSRGIGAGIALQLAKRGANVVVNYVSEGSKERADEIVKKNSENWRKGHSMPSYAALGNEADLKDVNVEMYNSHFDCNVRGPIFLTQAALPYLPRGGRIIFISSAAARLGVAGQTVYASTKAANEALARVWAKELGHSHGITVNCVNPGPVATDQWFQSDEQFLKDMQPMIEATPAAPRVGEVEDIAPLVAFLCTEDSKWTTGSVLSANGGLYN
ncbi:NAD(P)-binding protein [Penicillium waksmanii]|uniref:NAD(P)-binding protein n=1 Tax=Penicillium waksmanii TaxID=69791 RepID=UPI0025495DB6|nr:NAD(P)-binding protein [Penicillium waksmanii]KAJ5976022.1 NAD(P)-binding protein [Penicillium waksmanii]